MDHDLYLYRALRPTVPDSRPQRPLGHVGHGPADALTAGASPEVQAGRLQAFVVLFLEHWDAEPAPGQLRDPRLVGEYGSFTPDYRSWTQREYGLRIGIFRVIDALQGAGLTPAVAANARAVQRLPQLVDRLQRLGCEWVAHGLAATDILHSRMLLDAQREHVCASLDALQAATGVRPQGWLSQDWGTTPQTWQILADAGVRYVLDWCNDDQPYALRTSPPLHAVPLSAEWDDVQCQWLRHLEPQRHATLTLEAFDHLRGECATWGRDAVFGLPVHPWVTGMSSRIATFKRLLSDLRSRDDVQWTLPGQIRAHRSPTGICPQPALAP